MWNSYQTLPEKSNKRLIQQYGLSPLLPMDVPDPLPRPISDYDPRLIHGRELQDLSEQRHAATGRFGRYGHLLGDYRFSNVSPGRAAPTSYGAVPIPPSAGDTPVQQIPTTVDIGGGFGQNTLVATVGNRPAQIPSAPGDMDTGISLDSGDTPIQRRTQPTIDDSKGRVRPIFGGGPGEVSGPFGGGQASSAVSGGSGSGLTDVGIGEIGLANALAGDEIGNDLALGMGKEGAEYGGLAMLSGASPAQGLTVAAYKMFNPSPLSVVPTIARGLAQGQPARGAAEAAANVFGEDAATEAAAIEKGQLDPKAASIEGQMAASAASRSGAFVPSTVPGVVKGLFSEPNVTPSTITNEMAKFARAKTGIMTPEQREIDKATQKFNAENIAMAPFNAAMEDAYVSGLFQSGYDLNPVAQKGLAVMGGVQTGSHTENKGYTAPTGMQPQITADMVANQMQPQLPTGHSDRGAYADDLGGGTSVGGTSPGGSMGPAGTPGMAGMDAGPGGGPGVK